MLSLGWATTRSSIRRTSSRYLVLILAGCALAGCARDVVMVDPRTGATTICRASPLNPWSQQDSCIGDHVAQGWKRSETR